ncbi:DNA replication and repair protein RadC [Ekhidna lutea]|uniref:DNA replication and repair protein RadC n=2 Tax=Ekhidna lutea TaxID=447679 RepID=A0A239KRR9_EKHLU|nr:DNA replication and repair protein RadC [Ekhidna lutea]
MVYPEGFILHLAMEDNRLTIKRWAEEDRPREKLLLKGKSALSEAELIAILIGSGNTEQTAVELSQHILKQCGNSIASLARLSVKDLQKFKGIGEAKAISIVAALEIGRRRKEAEPMKRIKITSSNDGFELLRGDFMDLNHEEFWLILLKRNNEVIKKEMLSRGGVSGTVVDAKIIFKRALEETASGLILAHNHPSGNMKPSHEDINLTKRLKEAGRSLDISVLDHLIITDNDYFSFADEGLL